MADCVHQLFSLLIHLQLIHHCLAHLLDQLFLVVPKIHECALHADLFEQLLNCHACLANDGPPRQRGLIRRFDLFKRRLRLNLTQSPARRVEHALRADGAISPERTDIAIIIRLGFLRGRKLVILRLQPSRNDFLASFMMQRLPDLFRLQGRQRPRRYHLMRRTLNLWQLQLILGDLRLRQYILHST